MTHPTAVGWRAAPLGRAMLVVVLALSLLAVVAQSAAGAHPGAAASSGAHARLSSLPPAAQSAISAALGRDASAYRIGVPRGGVARANNGAQGLSARFARSGVQLRSGALKLGLRLRAVGYGTALAPVDEVAPSVSGNRVSYAHGQLSEWYLNGPLGLEQGFTFARAPSGAAAGPLTLSLALSGRVRASPVRGGASVILSGPDRSSLRYGGLLATDARGRTLPSRLALAKDRLLLRVDTRGASFPVRIDPLVADGRLPPVSDEAGGALLGFSAALSADGNTALVGGPRDGAYAGAVWVFTRSAGAWSQQGPKLTGGQPGAAGSEQCGEASGEEADECRVGRSIALSADGNTALVGSPREPVTCPECVSEGAAWVYTRSGSAWHLQAKLTGGVEEGGKGRFGHSVALSTDGNTALVGAPSDGGPPGAAWVFTRSGTTWSQPRPKLTASGEQGEAHLGGSVALSGDGNTALLGAPADNGYAGAAWVFTRSSPSSNWTQLGGKLTGSDEVGAAHFGFSVALSTDGTTALVGGRVDNGHAGAAWTFALSGSSWAPEGTKLTAGADGTPEAEFGSSLALSQDGSLALIGAPRDEGGFGAAWLFGRSGAGWDQQGPKLTSGQLRHGWLGTSVALSADGTTALIGAPNEEAQTGAVWVFADPALLPAATSVAPDVGPEAGGTSVTITGSRLAEASAVHFGSAPAASFTVNPDGSITAVSPPDPRKEETTQEGIEGKVRVTVTTPAGMSPTAGPVFTYLLAPAVKGVSPAEGPTTGGVDVTITGNHVGERTQAVKFGSVDASHFTVNSPESVTATSPPQTAGTVHVTVTTPGGVSKTGPPDKFTFVTAGAPPSSSSSAGGGGVPAGNGVLGFSSGCSAALLSRSLPVLKHARASVKLRWRGAGSCRGKVRLAVKVKKGRKLTTKTIATGTFSLVPGRTRTLLLKLGPVGRALFKSHHGRLPASLLIVSVASGKSLARSATVRLTTPPKRPPVKQRKTK
ncbi:MAG: hypothetical protein JWO23_2652 [Solirubrobacterales bacterium]|nr:hypothetical protein [Solirubrobacterales bacterium]